MDVFEFARQKEEAAEKTYRQLAEQADAPGLQHIFTYLADMEHRHARVVAAMSDGADAELEEPSLDQARSMFHRLAADKDLVLGEQRRQVDVYKQALQMEKESLQFYREQARQTESKNNRTIFQQLAEQEKMHYILVDNMVQFVMQPEVWVESPEFSHILDKYRGTDYYPGMMEYDT